MTIVLDASAVVDLLIGNDVGLAVADRLQDAANVVTVAHLDAEVLSALGRLHRGGALTVEQVDGRLVALGRMNVRRLPITSGLLRDAWSLNDRVAVRDALYIAAAARLAGKVLTTDLRLRRAAPELTTGPA